ncbi:MAG: hypothetical protein D6692_14600, partial [Planctomycetota bacterium]
IAAEIERATIAWAQAGVRVVQDGPILVENPPATPNTLDDPWKTVIHDGFLDVPAFVNSMDVIPAIEPLAGVAPDVLEVIFTAAIRSPGVQAILGATSRPGGHTVTGFPAALTENTYVFMGTDQDNNTISTPTTNDLRIRILAHEIGHALTNRSDTPNVDVTKYIFFPFRPPPNTSTPTDDDPSRRRRMTSSTERDALQVRLVGDLTSRGNRLLQTPGGAQ